MRYKVNKTDVINPGINSPEWENAKEEKLTAQRWKEFYQPIDVTFKMLKGPEGISVLMHTNEKNLRSVCKKQNGDVYCDSCMEFFFKPDPRDVNYLNIEINPDKFMYLAIRSGRTNPQLLDIDREIFSIESIPNDGDWTLKFYIPNSFLFKHFKNLAPVCRGNFFKCGDDTDHPHYITWSEVEVESPDYHIPDFFGYIEF